MHFLFSFYFSICSTLQEAHLEVFWKKFCKKEFYRVERDSSKYLSFLKMS